MGATDGGRPLTAGQREVLTYLARCGRATEGAIRANVRSGIYWPSNRTLKALAARGFVVETPLFVDAFGASTRWQITDEGKIAVGYKRFRVWFMGGNHADVIAMTEDDARQGPWNPSFGSLTNVVWLDDPTVALV